MERDGALKVERMAAHWELVPNFAQLMRPRAAHMRSMATMNASLVRNLGLGGTARFVGAISSVGTKGKRAVQAYLGTRVDDLDKVIASGNTVTANCTVDGQPAAVIATLDRKTRAVLDCRIYTDLIG